mgnify:CR=1 FL=1|tara:strand:+ start:103 stop:261 length:159 start_codon:yes stop_codon:yes gene_type:complete
MNIQTDDLQAVRNFAAAKGVTTATVYNWLKMGLLKGIEIDGVKFINKDDAKK